MVRGKESPGPPVLSDYDIRIGDVNVTETKGPLTG